MVILQCRRCQNIDRIPSKYSPLFYTCFYLAWHLPTCLETWRSQIDIVIVEIADSPLKQGKIGISADRAAWAQNWWNFRLSLLLPLSVVHLQNYPAKSVRRWIAHNGPWANVLLTLHLQRVNTALQCVNTTLYGVHWLVRIDLVGLGVCVGFWQSLEEVS